MKVARFVLKIVGWSLALAAAICCVVAYWDKLSDGLSGLKDKAAERRAHCHCPSEFDDYADWDE
ncbi:hypothetical protein [uncultured Intestinimonas sp.]|uniref:hypothetical protein n=1 Tax=uncultured Intestinimonas sp. TaxID=1689265 RepID=UPI0025D6E6E4|nr:hypothetical protein [uncultured Intestinimonas sp.]